jgi:sulfatase modifying factor 1
MLNAMRSSRGAAFAICALLGCSSNGGDGPDASTDASLLGDADAGDATAMNDAALEAAGPCPADMAFVRTDAGVCVDLYEGALVGADGGAWPFYDSIDAIDASALRAIPAKGIYPQGYISEAQASEMCAHSNKRLCTLAEWTAACRGQPDHDYVYPYGDTYDSTACNEGRESPIIRLFGPTPTYSNQELNDPQCDQLDAGLAQGGAYPKCVSTYGAFDMHGNLHEWIDDSPNPADLTKGSFMGGYFVDAKINGPGCEYRTTAHAKTYHDYSTGFRCCADPQ